MVRLIYNDDVTSKLRPKLATNIDSSLPRKNCRLTIHDGHLEVDEDAVVEAPLHQGEGLVAVACLVRGVPFALQQPLEEIAHDLRVVHDEDTPREPAAGATV